MRLHRLDLTAFGPFGAPQTVDFDALSAAGLFLLHGPTGAGKTSVLDAVCYALYGSVPGARQSGQGLALRSDHAAPGTRTEVTLELTVSGRRLEITRQPPHERAKKRGSGTTVEKAQSGLREYDPVAGAWKDLSRSHQEIGEEITQLLGMSREQFCQVVLLPQGDFARFLRADAEARGRLLGRLFDTQRFAEVEKRLAERRRTTEARVREGDSALLADAHRMQQVAGDAMELPELAPGEPGLAEAVLAASAVARSTSRELLTTAHCGRLAAESAQAAAERALEDVRERARLQRRFAEARERAALLQERAGAHREAQARMERARKAEAVAPTLELREAADAEHTEASAHAARARARLPERFADAGAAGLAAAARRAAEELGGLESARRDERRLADLVAERADLDRRERDDEDVLTETEAWLAGWETVRADLQARIESALEAATRAEQLDGRREPAQRRLKAARLRDELARDLEAAQRTALTFGERAQTARAHWLDLKEQRLNGIAAELAATLVAGEPCAVCGATEHPAPARKVAGHVDREAEEQALTAYQRAEERHAEDEQKLGLVREALAAATAEAGDTPTDRLAADAQELELAYAQARRDASALHPAREELRQAEQEHERRTAAQREAAVRAASRVGHRERLERERAALEEELAQARGTAESVAARAAQLERQAALLTDAADTARVAEESAERLKAADGRLDEAAFRAASTPRRPQPTPSSTTPPTASCNGGWTPGSPRRQPYAPSSPNPTPRPPPSGRPSTSPPRNSRRPTRPNASGRPPPPRTPPPAAAPNSTASPRARPTACAGSSRCARSTTGWPAWPVSPPVPPPTTSARCAWRRTSWRPASNRWPPPRPYGCSACPPGATPSSTPTTVPDAGAAGSGCTSSTPGPGASGTRPRCRAARRSSPRSPSPSAWRTSSPTRRAGSASTPSSSTRGSAASTTRPSTRSSTSSTRCGNATAASASSATSPTCGGGSTRSWRSSRGDRGRRYGSGVSDRAGAGAAVRSRRRWW